MPGYKQTGALASLGAASPSPEMEAFRQRQMQNGIGASTNPNAMSVMNETYGASIAPNEMGGINPYTYENLMRLPSGETVIQYMADSAGLPVEEVINQMKMGNIPQEGMQMLFEEAFNIMSAPKGGSAMDRYNQRR